MVERLNPDFSCKCMRASDNGRYVYYADYDMAMRIILQSKQENARLERTNEALRQENYDLIRAREHFKQKSQKLGEENAGQKAALESATMKLAECAGERDGLKEQVNTVISRYGQEVEGLRAYNEQLKNDNKVCQRCETFLKDLKALREQYRLLQVKHGGLITSEIRHKNDIANLERVIEELRTKDKCATYAFTIGDYMFFLAANGLVDEEHS